jgi:hypothetical protein
MTIVIRSLTAALLFQVVTAASAAAQVGGQSLPPPPAGLTFRGMEAGIDVTTSTPGEAGFYFGAASNRGVMSVRFSTMDEGESVPCSFGVMYEHLFGKDHARITPSVGATVGRVFSCASENDGARPSPLQPGLGALTAGVRVPIFAGHRRVGSVKVLGIAQRRFGSNGVAPETNYGFSVGFVVGRR